MSENKVEFTEDPAHFKPIPIEKEIGGASIEGWFYKRFPGSQKIKKMILILIAILLLGLSIFFLLLSYMNTQEEDIEQNFQERIQNSQLR